MYDRYNGALAHCLHWPSSMRGLMAIYGVFAFDVIADARASCYVTGFDMFWKVKIAMFSPLIVVAVIVLVGILNASHQTHKRRRTKITMSTSKVEHAVQRGSHNSVLRTGLWKAAPVALFLLDLLQPMTCRILGSFFFCRPLGAAGRWLEASQDFAEHFCMYE